MRSKLSIITREKYGAAAFKPTRHGTAVTPFPLRMGAALAAKGKNHRSGVSRSGKFYLHSSSPKTADSKIMAIGEGDFLRTAFQTPWTTHRMAKIRMPVQSGDTRD